MTRVSRSHVSPWAVHSFEGCSRTPLPQLQNSGTPGTPFVFFDSGHQIGPGTSTRPPKTYRPYGDENSLGALLCRRCPVTITPSPPPPPCEPDSTEQVVRMRLYYFSDAHAMMLRIPKRYSGKSTAVLASTGDHS